MIKCPSCGFNNADSRERCVKCQTMLKAQAVPDGSHTADKGREAPNPLVSIRRSYYFLGEKLRGRLPENVPHRYPWSAAYLSILFGAGQLYNHQPRKAVLFACLYIALVGWIVYTWFDYGNNAAVLVAFFWMLYAIADGYSIAVKVNGEAFNWRNVAAVWFAFMFLISGVVFLGQFFSYGFFQMTTVKTDTMAPALERGDKVFTLSAGEGLLMKRGSIVYFDPPPLVYERPGGLSTDIYSLNQQNGWGVITAVEGDLVKWEPGGPIKVNGEPIPPAWLPINPDGYPGSMEARVPKDHVCILFTHGVSQGGLLSFLGGSYGSAVPNPRIAAQSGYIIKNYEEAIMVPRSAIWGITLFRYYPPPRREWWGTGQGFWGEVRGEE